MKCTCWLVTIAILVSCSNNQYTETTGGWKKYKQNPVLGGALGTIIDVGIVHKTGTLSQMFCSWHPKRSIALSESRDGLKWSDPLICLSFNDNSRWERDVNRPVVI